MRCDSWRRLLSDKYGNDEVLQQRIRSSCDGASSADGWHSPCALCVSTQVNESLMLNQQTSSLMRAIDAFNEAIMLVDTSEASWTIMFINDAWLRMMSAPPTNLFA